MLLQLKNAAVYGPVRSRRLGRSLGINALPPAKKACTFNCLYCQYGWTDARAVLRRLGDVTLQVLFTVGQAGNTAPDHLGALDRGGKTGYRCTPHRSTAGRLTTGSRPSPRAHRRRLMPCHPPR